jgi:hypothetical protein
MRVGVLRPSGCVSSSFLDGLLKLAEGIGARQFVWTDFYSAFVDHHVAHRVARGSD